MGNYLTTEVWAQLFLSAHDRQRIIEFAVKYFGLKPKVFVRNMHITVYYARRPMPGVTALSEPVAVVIPAADTRFMVMAPGGENPKPHLDPGKKKVGIRIHKKSNALTKIMEYRNRLIKFESVRVLGSRSPSTNWKNAFGARHFQPHMAVLFPGSGIDKDLRLMGEPFRQQIGDLTFDRFEIDVVTKSAENPLYPRNPIKPTIKEKISAP